jgi:antitoxin (DNA-binding transcriptional repressor) of toxin-antitoxin stability system
MTKIQLEEATAPLEEILKSIPEGDDVIFLNGDQPIARFLAIPLVSIGRRFGSGRGSAVMSEDFNDPIDDFDPYTS